MLQEDDGVVLLEVLQQPPAGPGGQMVAVHHVAQKSLEALQGRRLPLVFVLLPRHLLAESERCSGGGGEKGDRWVCYNSQPYYSVYHIASSLKIVIR